MNAALGALLVQVVLCACGLALSLWMDRDRPRADRPHLVARRKPGALGRRLPLIGFNIALICVLLPGSIWALGEKFPVTVPSPGVFLVQLAIIFACDDFSFYWVHRAMHRSRRLYRRIHRFHHEAASPVPIEFIYAHPLEVLLGGIGTALGFALALVIFGQVSAYTLWFGVAVRLAHEMKIHSGPRKIVEAPIPFSHTAERHARHHAGRAHGNYASTFTLWDRLFQTRIQP